MRWANRQARLREACKGRGKKSECAKALGIRRPVLSRILHEPPQPRAELVLAIQAWIFTQIGVRVSFAAGDEIQCVSVDQAKQDAERIGAQHCRAKGCIIEITAPCVVTIGPAQNVQEARA